MVHLLTQMLWPTASGWCTSSGKVMVFSEASRCFSPGSVCSRAPASATTSSSTNHGTTTHCPTTRTAARRLLQSHQTAATSVLDRSTTILKTQSLLLYSPEKCLPARVQFRGGSEMLVAPVADATTGSLKAILIGFNYKNSSML